MGVISPRNPCADRTAGSASGTDSAVREVLSQDDTDRHSHRGDHSPDRRRALFLVRRAD